ncbi:hypothetical protein DN752_21635 [Echinicola strongylocentroti]|uniref:SGNH/GDSL hydrolase family protein n=1 Tax=Echinicola strongylocentroti TaxID=1795355 RepID=A0A2Z4IP58_9BACT|nr:hypothetical protein [Echinicola strongylocentroti]AWW32540.1 hypothetical protein DN752_21635 [Echinicola strongylocentroti]
MKKLIKNLVIISVSFLLVDYTVGLILDTTLKNSPDGRFYKIQHTLADCTDDIIIYGSSRAESNYSPKVFEDSLGLTCWNSGRGGQSLPFMYALNGAVTQRHSPKIAIINVEDIFLEYTEKEHPFFDRAAGLLRPFYTDHSAVRSIVNHNSYAEPYLNYSSLYAYNSSYYYLLRPYAIEGLDGKIEDDGWKPKHGKLKSKNYKQRVVHEKNQLNPEYVALFDEFITSLRNRGTQVYVVTSPNYKEKVISTQTLEHIKNRKDIIFLDYFNDTMFTENKTFYNDPNHMNRTGALAFSADIASKIKSQSNYLTTSE